MNIGMISGWLLAAVIGHVLGGFPGDLCIAGAAIGIGLSLACSARSVKALYTVAPAVMLLLMRYTVVPQLLRAAPEQAAQNAQLMELLVSPPTLIVLSLLSIAASYMLGMRWVHTGEA